MIFEHTRTMNWEGALRGMRNPKNSWAKSDSIFGITKISDGKTFKSLSGNAGCLIDSHGDPMRLAYKVYESYPYAEVISIGPEDMRLAQDLIRAGSEHRKFMRMIFVCTDITAPLYWWKEFDTYKVATVRNSCSTMHKLHSKEITIDDFEHDVIDDLEIEIHGCIADASNDYKDAVSEKAIDWFSSHIDFCEKLRQLYNETHEKQYWRALIQSLPDSYLMKATVTFSYETLFAMCSKGQRRFHKQNEWSGIDNREVPHLIGWARALPYAPHFIFIDEFDTLDPNLKNLEIK